MEKFEIPKVKSEKEPLEKFTDFFPEGKIEKIKFKDLPEKAQVRFEGYSRRFILPENYKPKNFSKIFLVRHDGGDLTYAVAQTKDFEDAGTEEEIYLLEERRGEEVGHGEIRRNISFSDEYFKDKPFVGFTQTEDNFLGEGLGKKRLLLMNALTQTLYNQPLCSGTLFSHQAAVRNWEKLVEEGKAKKFKEGKEDRYVML